MSRLEGAIRLDLVRSDVELVTYWRAGFAAGKAAAAVALGRLAIRETTDAAIAEATLAFHAAAVVRGVRDASGYMLTLRCAPWDGSWFWEVSPPDITYGNARARWVAQGLNAGWRGVGREPL